MKAFLMVYALAVVANFPWELLQRQLYRGMRTLLGDLWHCLFAALGDGALMLLIVFVGWILLRDRDWYLRLRPSAYALMLATGASLAVVVEKVALDWGRWAYTEQMPIVPFVNIGLTPLIQMLILPPLVFVTTGLLLRRIKYISSITAGTHGADRQLRLLVRRNRMEAQSERLFFIGQAGAKLAARLDRPATQPVTYALFAHCFTCSKDYHAVSRISRALAARGIAVLRFDFTGLGESEGDFADTNFSSNLEDLLGAAEFLRNNLGLPELLIGHSLGGSAVLAAARSIPESSAVVTIGAPSDPGHLRPILAGAAPEIEAEGEAEVVVAGRKFRIKRQLLEDLREHNLLRAIGDLAKALLVLHSPADKTVGIEHAHRIFEAAKHPKSFVAIEGADHLLTNQAASDYVASVISAWAVWYTGKIK